MTNEQWAFCAGLATGASAYLAGMITGAFLLYKYLVVLTGRDQERRIRKTEELSSAFTSQKLKPNKDGLS